MAQPASGNGGRIYIAAAIGITAILVSATFVLVPISRSTTTETFISSTTATETVTSTNTQTTTLTSVSTSVSTSYTTLTSVSTSLSTSYALLPADCTSALSSPAPSRVTVVAGGSSPAVICLQLYDFNSTSPIVLNTTSLLSILGPGPSGSGAENFTITTSQDQLTMGGPSNLNEGTIVAYAITAQPGASGTYGLHINAWQINQGGEECGLEGILIAGTGQPDYTKGITSLCIYLEVPTPTPYSIPGVNYNIGSNEVYFKMVDALNSTQ